MNILHYSLGLPPYRSGGLTKYSIDLMINQANSGNNMFMLFPGKINNRDTTIRYYKLFKNIQVYELVNPLPIPLLNGIKEPKKFMRDVNAQFYKDFLLDKKIDIVHIHTLMGLHQEFFDVCKELSISTVFTTHDYFGLCTKVNFTTLEGNICNSRDINKCIICNSTAYNMNTIYIQQLPLYRFIKSMPITLTIQKIIESMKNISNSKPTINEKCFINKKDYNELINYYKNHYDKINYFIFNSTVAEEVYKSYLDCHGEVLSISHTHIRDNRIKKDYSNPMLRITYLGPNKRYKGINLLYSVMKTLNSKGYNDIILNVYGCSDKSLSNDNIRFNGKYCYSDLEKIFSHTDLLIVPSLWKETFGFVTLEALSYGVPVLVTSNVGSKDLLVNKNKHRGIVVEPNLEDILATIIELYKNRKILEEMNTNILNSKFEWMMDQHVKDIYDIYLKVIK